MKKLFIPMFLLIFLSGCMYYYKIQTVRPVAANTFKQYDSLNKYLILHLKDTAWHLSVMNIKDIELFGKLSTLPDYRMKYKTTKPNAWNRYKRMEVQDENYVLEEVHLYLQDSLFSEVYAGDAINLQYSAISKVDVYIKDKGKTTASWLIPAFGVPVLGLIILILIAGASMSGGM
jgi:hypothetical protein